MIVKLNESTCIVEREDTDAKIYDDSVLLYHVKQELIKQGFDVIKKLQWQDGNLVDSSQHWIRTRNWNSNNPDAFAVYWSHYAIEYAHRVYDEAGRVVLNVLR